MMTERLICLADATAERPKQHGRMSQPWAATLQAWFRCSAPPSPRQTGDAITIALGHLPEWVDAGTAQALREVIHEENSRAGPEERPSADSVRTGAKARLRILLRPTAMLVVRLRQRSRRSGP
jgi:hypothetical protein